jgi:hypothetical protein
MAVKILKNEGVVPEEIVLRGEISRAYSGMVSLSSEER